MRVIPHPVFDAPAGASTDPPRPTVLSMTAARLPDPARRHPRELSAAMDLRYEVFCVEQGVPRREERDGRDSRRCT